MTLLVISPDYASHLLPLATLATAWQDAGESVVVATGPATADIVADFGFRRAELVLRERPGVSGTRRYTHRLTAGRADWQQPRVVASYRWLRDGKPIAGARHRRYRLSHLDVGHHVQVRVTARKEGYRTARTTSRGKRARACHDPPYSSLRWFSRGLMNELSR